MLAQHPDIFMCDPKEPNFFSQDHRFEKGIEYYSEPFRTGTGSMIRGEASACYMVSRKAVERMQKLLPAETKFVFLLRNPIDRAYSHYMWLKGMGFGKAATFWEAFKRDLHRQGELIPNVKRDFYYHAGCYGEWLGRYIDAFGRDRLLVVSSNDFREQPLACINRCCAFLETPPPTHLEAPEKNRTVILKHPGLFQRIWFAGKSLPGRMLKPMLPASSKPIFLRWRGHRLGYLDRELKSSSCAPLDDKQRQWLADIYRQDVGLLRRLTGLAFEEWASTILSMNTRLRLHG